MGMLWEDKTWVEGGPVQTKFPKEVDFNLVSRVMMMEVLEGI